MCTFSGPGYNANYGHPETSYAGNPYPPNYGMSPMNPVHPVSFNLCVFNEEKKYLLTGY